LLPGAPPAIGLLHITMTDEVTTQSEEPLPQAVPTANTNAPAHHQPWPSIGGAVVVWLRVAMLSFGGPAGQIAVMHRIIVEEKRWIDDARFIHSLNFCMLLPGPEAQQLATYIGWLMHRTRGGLIAGGLFVLPGLIAIMLLSWIYVVFGELEFVVWVFFGLKCAVLAIVFAALNKIGRRILHHPLLLAIAVASFILIFAVALPFPLIILLAGLIGFLGAWFNLAAFNPLSHGPSDSPATTTATSLLGDQLPEHANASLARQLKLIAILLILWLTPLVLLLLLLGDASVYTNIVIFFSKMAVVTFGGAYAVLAYVAQAAVETFAWVKPDEMLDGLGMAETTPGPLIMVTQFVGFMAAFRDAGTLSPLLAGTLGGLLTTWVTFVPCFLWIFAGAPFIEKLRKSQHLSGALTAITAAVVGVIANLAIWFALHLLFEKVSQSEMGIFQLLIPELDSVNYLAALITILMLLAAFKFKLGSGWLILLAATIGLVSGAAGFLT